MEKITYEQAYKDHSYLWSIAPACDMSREYQSCGKCGFKMRADRWLDLEWALIRGGEDGR